MIINLIPSIIIALLIGIGIAFLVSFIEKRMANKKGSLEEIQKHPDYILKKQKEVNNGRNNFPLARVNSFDRGVEDGNGGSQEKSPDMGTREERGEIQRGINDETESHQPHTPTPRKPIKLFKT